MDVTDLKDAQNGLRVVQRDLHWALSNASKIETLVLLPIISDAVDLLDRVDALMQAVGGDA